jgi:hypothetical protein
MHAQSHGAWRVRGETVGGDGDEDGAEAQVHKQERPRRQHAQRARRQHRAPPARL